MKRLTILISVLFCLLARTMGQSVMSRASNQSGNSFKNVLDSDSLLTQLFQIKGLEQIRTEAQSSLKSLKSMVLFDRMNNTVKKAKNLKSVYHSTIVNVNYYGTNLSDSAIGSKDFLNANAQFNLKVFDIPFSVQTSAVFEQGKLRTDFSYTNIQFNWGQYRESIQQKISTNALKDYFKVDDITEQFKLNKLDSTTLMTDAKFTFYNTVINHPRVKELKYQVESQLDSFLHQRDSLCMSNVQKYIDSLSGLKQTLQKFEQKYDALWQKKVELFGTMEQLKSKLSTAEQELNKLSNPEYLKKKAMQSRNIGLKDRLMLNTKGLDFGQFGADEDDFTLKNQLLNGVRYEYEGRKNNYGFIAGNSRLRGLETPVFYDPFQRLLLGRQFVYFKYGYITSDSSCVQFRILNVHRTNDTLFGGGLTANYNTVLALSYEKKLSKKWSILTDVAHSSLSGGLLSNVEQPQRIFDDLAVSSSLFMTYQKAFKLGVGYFYVGNHFITYGNGFLLNNRNGLKLDAQASVFKNKLKLKASVKTGFINDPSVLGLSQSNITQITGDINWQVSKSGSIQFQYSPNTIVQSYSTDRAKRYDYKTNIYLLSSIFNYKIGQNRQSTVVVLSNLNQQVDYFDSLRFNRSLYTNIRHESFITSKSSIVLSSNLGFLNSFNAVQTGLIQSDFRFQISKKCRVTTGLQVAKRLTEDYWKGGGVSNLTFNLNKLNIKIGAIYRKQLYGSIPVKDEWIGNTSMTMRF